MIVWCCLRAVRWLLVVGCSLIVVCSSLLVVHCWLFGFSV